MAAATPHSNPKPAGDDRNLVAVDATNAATFEDRIHLFWQKNRNLVVGACVAVLLAILAKGAWDYMARQKLLDVQKTYAAATTPDQLKAFVAAHPRHSLGALAQLRLADDAYTAGNSAEAIAGYDKALAAIKAGPLAARAKLGRALAKAQAGQTAAANDELRQLANDTTQLNAIRSEAAYHLASFAAEAGNADEVQTLVGQLMQIDPTSMWTQRALALRASLPAPAAPAASAPDEDGGPRIELKLPGR
jgi:hypothetical protein